MYVSPFLEENTRQCTCKSSRPAGGIYVPYLNQDRRYRVALFFSDGGDGKFTQPHERYTRGAVMLDGPLLPLHDGTGRSRRAKACTSLLICGGLHCVSENTRAFLGIIGAGVFCSERFSFCGAATHGRRLRSECCIVPMRLL